MACGSAMTVCVDCENRVWSWGAKKYIGRPYGYICSEDEEMRENLPINICRSEPDESLSKKASKKNTPKKNPSTSSVKHRRVGTSPVHITKSRSNPPNLKNPNTNLPSYKIPGIVDLPTAVVVTQICCGESHTVIRGETGKVYGWGANDMGQLGFHKRKPVLTPQEIGNYCTAFANASDYLL
jgi:alpha-tubulin suppressor-like RCC1 family protein